MRRVMHFQPSELKPDVAGVLLRQGIPLAAAVSPRLRALQSDAADIFVRLVRPAAVVEQLTTAEFDEIYAASGANGADTPLGRIVPRADALALFAATLGPLVDGAIRDLFREREAALAFTLDAFAAAAAESLAEMVAAQYHDVLDPQPASQSALRVLPYCCGLCGWPVGGQAPLFARLRPQDIGIELTAKCLMSPEKSVSGVLIAGAPATHVFRPTFPFCDPCVTRSCRDRMRGVRVG